jgi:putative membrane protein
VRPNLREHQANERTFLAWLRTSIAIIAFGFVLERFSLFLQYMAPASPAKAVNPYTSVVGVGLIGLGTLMIPVSLWRFLLEERHIDAATQATTGNWPLIILSILLAAVGVYLALAVRM